MGALVSTEFDLLLNTLDSLYIPAFIVDENRRVLSANTAAGGALGCSLRDIQGQDIARYVAVSDAHLGPKASGAGVCFESFCAMRNGECFAARVTVLPQAAASNEMKSPESEKAARFVVTVQDVSGHRRLQQKASQRTKEIAIWNAFASILARHAESEKIMQELLDMLARIMGVEAAWIHLFDEKTGMLLLKAHKGGCPELLAGQESLKPGQCLCGKVFVSGRPLLVKKVSEDPRIQNIDPLACGVESIAAVPITSNRVVWGVLAVAARKPARFTSMDMQPLAAIGGQLGVAIENTKLIGQLRDKMEHIELINELSGIVNSSLSIGTIFRMMVSEIKKIIDYDRSSLLLFNEERQNLLIFALDTGMKTVMTKGVKAPIDTTSAGWVIKNNKPWINYDLRRELRFPDDGKLLQEGIRSTISIPLYKDRMLGVFNLDSTGPLKYSEKDLQILLSVSKHISVALENALLFEEISKEKREWRKTFDAITDMVWIEDTGQRIIRANQALLRKSGFSRGQVMGKPCKEVMEKIGIRAETRLCGETAASGRPSFRELAGRGGGIFHFWAYPLVDEEGRMYAMVHYLKDVTERIRLEQHLIRANRLASLGTMVAGIAHEINNPLGIIAGYSDALMDRARDEALLSQPQFEDFPEYLETINKEIFRCKGILRSLLDFASPSSGSFRLLDINEIIKEVILLVNHRAKRLHHRMEFNLRRDLPKIYGEPGALRQVFMNIIINSLYFTPERGSIVITTRLNAPGQDGPQPGLDEDLEGQAGPDKDQAGPQGPSAGRPITAAGRADKPERPKTIIVPEAIMVPEPPMIEVVIQDTGAGIPREMMERIFDPFFTTKPAGEGTGLGLSICHRIVEEHGGSIDAQSEPGKGTMFIIKIPAGALGGPPVKADGPQGKQARKRYTIKGQGLDPI